jgi:hypothetical protein
MADCCTFGEARHKLLAAIFKTMKKLILILLTILLSRQSFAQMDSSKSLNQKRIYGINLYVKYVAVQFSAAVGLGMSISEKKHFFLFGITIPPLTSYIDMKGQELGYYAKNNCWFYKIKSEGFGLDFTYRLYPKPQNEYLIFFYFYDFALTRITNKVDCSFYNDTISTHNYWNGNETDYLITNNIGIGIKIKMFKNVYSNIQAGAGIGLTGINGYAKCFDIPSLDFKRNGYLEILPTVLIKIGFEYKL